MIIIPASPDDSAAHVAKALAEIGQRLSYAPVTAITINSLEYGTALALVDLQQHIERQRDRPGPPEEPQPVVVPVPTEPAAVAPDAGLNGAPADGQPEAPTTEALTVIPPARVIIAIPSVVSEPLGLSATREADLVVLKVRLGATRLADVKKTVSLIGRDHVAGCYVER
jgi:hypothetical protein